MLAMVPLGHLGWKEGGSHLWAPHFCPNSVWFLAFLFHVGPMYLPLPTYRDCQVVPELPFPSFSNGLVHVWASGYLCTWQKVQMKRANWLEHLLNSGRKKRQTEIIALVFTGDQVCLSALLKRNWVVFLNSFCLLLSDGQRWVHCIQEREDWSIQRFHMQCPATTHAALVTAGGHEGA